MRRCLLALFGLVATCSSAFSASISAEVDGDGFAYISITGEIRRGDDLTFQIEALKHEKAAVILESPGGSLQAGLRIGKLIHERQFWTGVMNSHCESACALVWMGGVKRFVSNRAKIGFHAAYVDIGEGAVSGAGNALVGAYLSRLGYSDKVIEFATDAQPDDMDYLTAARAAELGVSYINLDEMRSNRKAPPSDKPFERPAATVPQQVIQPTPSQQASPNPTNIVTYPGPVKPRQYDGPKFKDYQTPPPIQFLLPTQVDFSDPQARRFKTRLVEAAAGDINFAGQYKLTTWGCGANCETGAMVDANTGQVIFLPFTVCCESWQRTPDFKRVLFRNNSRLLVASGLINEQGENGVHFIEFRDGTFTHIATRPPIQPTAPQPQSYGGAASATTPPVAAPPSTTWYNPSR